VKTSFIISHSASFTVLANRKIKFLLIESKWSICYVCRSNPTKLRRYILNLKRNSKSLNIDLTVGLQTHGQLPPRELSQLARRRWWRGR